MEKGLSGLLIAACVALAQGCVLGHEGDEAFHNHAGTTYHSGGGDEEVRGTCPFGWVPNWSDARASDDVADIYEPAPVDVVDLVEDDEVFAPFDAVDLAEDVPPEVAAEP